MLITDAIVDWRVKRQTLSAKHQVVTNSNIHLIPVSKEIPLAQKKKTMLRDRHAQRTKAKKREKKRLTIATRAKYDQEKDHTTQIVKIKIYAYSIWTAAVVHCSLVE